MRVLGRDPLNQVRLEEDRAALLLALEPHLEGTTGLPMPVLSTGEVALLFRVTATTIRRWAEARKIEGKRSPGGQWVFPLQAVRSAFDLTSSGSRLGPSDAEAPRAD